MFHNSHSLGSLKAMRDLYNSSSVVHTKVLSPNFVKWKVQGLCTRLGYGVNPLLEISTPTLYYTLNPKS